MIRSFVCLFSVLTMAFIFGAGISSAQLYVVSGEVTSSSTGDPVENVYVQAYYNGDPVSGASDYTDIDGQYSFEIISGTYDIDFQPPPESGLRSKLVEGVVVQDDVELNVALEDAFKIEGYVYDSDGTGIPDIDLNIYDQETGEQLEIGGDDTDETGYYDVYVPPGIYRIVYRPVSGERYVPVELTNVEVFADIWIDVVLEDGWFISGTVTGPQGVVEGADIDVEDSQTGIKLYTPGDNTDTDGFYQVLVPAGTFNVTVDPPDGENLAPAIAYDVVVSGDITLDFVLETGYELSGIVTDPFGDGVFDADLDVKDSQTGLDLFTPRDNTDESGNYHVVVPVGNYDVSVTAQIVDRLVPGIEYGIAVSGNASLDFTLQAGYLLSGIVKDPDLNVVADVDLNVIDVSNGIQLFTPSDNTDSEGYYQVVVPAGLYNLDYRPPVIPPYLAPVRMENQSIIDDTAIDVTLPYGLQLSGLVLDSHGAGVQNVDIDAEDATNGGSIPLVGDYTDENGAFTTVMIAGTYNLEIEPPANRHLAAEKIYDYVLNTDSYIEVPLDSGMVVSGTVTSHDNNPMPDVNIWVVESSTQEDVFTPGNVTDADGFYSITVKPDTYDLTFDPDPIYGYPDSTISDVDISTDTIIDVQFGEQEQDTEPPTISVLSPNGGESWAVYSNQIVSWSASDNIGVTSIDIYCSIDGESGTYVLIASGEEDDGLYVWNVPPTPTENAWMKIVAFDASSNSGEDVSDGAFTIYANPSECSYEPGDINHNGVPIELPDVVSMIGIYRGTVSPYYTCPCPPHGESFPPEADPNGNCTANELSDVIVEIGAYRGTANASGCVDCPGLRRINPDGGQKDSVSPRME
jgi:hypothetical protein